MDLGIAFGNPLSSEASTQRNNRSTNVRKPPYFSQSSLLFSLESSHYLWKNPFVRNETKYPGVAQLVGRLVWELEH